MSRLLSRRVVRAALCVLLSAAVAPSILTSEKARAVDYTPNCTTAALIQAVLDANATTANDTIILSAGCNYVFTDDYNNLGTALPPIGTTNTSGILNIVSYGSSGSTISRSTARGIPEFGLIETASSSGGDTNLLLFNITFSNGVSTFGGAIDTNDAGRINVDNCRFTENGASQRGGAIYATTGVQLEVFDTLFLSNSAISTGGGAIYAAGSSLVLSASELITNFTVVDGGAITAVSGSVYISQTMMHSNVAFRNGGGVFIGTNVTSATISGSTLYGNTADENGDGTGDGGNLYRNTTDATKLVKVNNTVLAQGIDKSPAPTDKYPDALARFEVSTTSGRHNLIGIGTGALGVSNGVNGNKIGTTAAPLSPDLLYFNDTANAQREYYYQPHPSSPVINAGDNTVVNLDFERLDQIGKPRILNGTVDIGAVEYKRPDSPVVVLPSSGAWLFRYTNTAGAPNLSFLYGQGLSDYTPIAGDWDGDGDDTQGVYTRFTSSNIGVFALSNTFNSFDAATLPAFPYTDASSAWVPVKGDWDNNRSDTIGAYNTSTGLWSLNNQNLSNAPEYTFVFGGGAGVVPVTGDWDGDGYDGIGVYSFSTGNWTLCQYFQDGVAVDLSISFSALGYYPVAGDWDGDGIDTPGLYNPTTGQWLLRNFLTSGAANVAFQYGADANLRGVSGKWLNVTPGGGADPIRESVVTPDAPQIAPTFAP